MIGWFVAGIIVGAALMLLAGLCAAAGRQVEGADNA